MDRTKKTIYKANGLLMDVVTKFEKDETSFFANKEYRRDALMKINIIKNVLISIKSRLSSIENLPKELLKERQSLLKEVQESLEIIERIMSHKIPNKVAQLAKVVHAHAASLGWFDKGKRKILWNRLKRKFKWGEKEISFPILRLKFALSFFLFMILISSKILAQVNLGEDPQTALNMYKGHLYMNLLSESRIEKLDSTIKVLEKEISKEDRKALKSLLQMGMIEARGDKEYNKKLIIMNKKIADAYHKVLTHIKDKDFTKMILEKSTITIVLNDSTLRKIDTGFEFQRNYKVYNLEDIHELVAQLKEKEELIIFFTDLSE